MIQTRRFRFHLIVLALALMSLALVRVQAGPSQDAAAGNSGATCVTTCPLPGQGHALPLEARHPTTDHAAAGFAPLQPRPESSISATVPGRYLPVILHGVDGPSSSTSTSTANAT
ncbi:MAG TPA: hypothetical protein VLC95_06325 [Anaerolineae bacterium]|nr:hypothetical protein [Anaerolineae bacterium]